MYLVQWLGVGGWETASEHAFLWRAKKKLTKLSMSPKAALEWRLCLADAEGELVTLYVIYKCIPMPLLKQDKWWKFNSSHYGDRVIVKADNKSVAIGTENGTQSAAVVNYARREFNNFVYNLICYYHGR